MLFWSFKLFFGTSGQISTYNVTQDYHYQIVVNTVEQIRNRLLQEEVLRQSFLHLFKSVYNNNTDFPEDLKLSTPIADHIPNMSKVREIRRHPPTDADVVKFLTAASSYIQIYEMFLAKVMKWVWQSYEMGLIKGRPSGIPLSTVMNHIPLHPITIKSHPNLISIPPKPSTVVSDVSTISRCFITLHIITPSFHHHYSSPSISVITVLHYFGSHPPLLRSKHHSQLCG